MNDDKNINADSSEQCIASDECTLIEFKRKASKEYTRPHSGFVWFSITNTRLIVYVAFLALLTVFSVYYAVQKDYLISVFSTLAAAFMVYIIANGHNLFAFTSQSDAVEDGTDIRMTITEKMAYVFIGDQCEAIPKKDIKFKYNKKFIFFSFNKKSKLCKDGLVFDNTDIDIKQVEVALSSGDVDDNK